VTINHNSPNKRIAEPNLIPAQICEQYQRQSLRNQRSSNVYEDTFLDSIYNSENIITSIFTIILIE